MSDIRVVDTPTLRKLVRIADKLELNRIPSDEVMARLDPDGFHVLSLILYGHNMDSAPVLHHRALVLIKVTDSDDPVEVALDVPDAQWTGLPVPVK